jgi:hypothetical protein
MLTEYFCINIISSFFLFNWFIPCLCIMQDAVILQCWRTAMHVLKEQCIMTVQSALRLVFSCSFRSVGLFPWWKLKCWLQIIFWLIMSWFSVLVWVNKRCVCLAMWSYNSWELLERNGGTLPVSLIWPSVYNSLSRLVLWQLTCLKMSFRFACPLCSKSVCDMSKAWERLDVELARLSDSWDDRMVLFLLLLVQSWRIITNLGATYF